jgi:hypothetical protein
MARSGLIITLGRSSTETVTLCNQIPAQSPIENNSGAGNNYRPGTNSWQRFRMPQQIQ